MSWNEGAARAVRRARFPDAEELRMVRAIAMVVLLEAARRGEYRASFHGFRIQAARRRTPQVAAFVEVNLCVTWHGHPVELEVMSMEPPETSATLSDGSEATGANGLEPMPNESVWIESTLLDGALGHSCRAEAVGVLRWLCQPD